MKRRTCLILALIMCLGLFACGNKKEKAKEPELEAHKLGEMVETDILQFTLLNAQFAIKLNSTSSGTYEQIQSGDTALSRNYFLPEEYDPATDTGVGYIAAKGHTYVTFEYLVTNLDRISLSFGSLDDFISVKYNGKTYDANIDYGCQSANSYAWKRLNAGYMTLEANESLYFRACVDIPVDAADLSDNFDLTFALPTSQDHTTKFRYAVTAEDRAIFESQEISVQEAIYIFLEEEEGQNYFKNHMDEYRILTGEEIKTAISGHFRVMRMLNENGYWYGGFTFDEDGRIEEYIPEIGTGYFNDRTWKVNGDSLIIDDEHVCQVRRIEDIGYLLVKNGEPFAIM